MLKVLLIQAVSVAWTLKFINNSYTRMDATTSSSTHSWTTIPITLVDPLSIQQTFIKSRASSRGSVGLCLRMCILESCDGGLNSGRAAVRPWINGFSKANWSELPVCLVVPLPRYLNFIHYKHWNLENDCDFPLPADDKKTELIMHGFLLVNRPSRQAFCYQFYSGSTLFPILFSPCLA